MEDKEFTERLKKIERDVEWLIQYLLKKDEPTPVPPFIPDYPYNRETRCSKCGMVFSGITGYSCPDAQCPTFAKTYCVSNTYANPAPESYFESIRASRENMSSAGDKDYED